MRPLLEPQSFATLVRIKGAVARPLPYSGMANSKIGQILCGVKATLSRIQTAKLVSKSLTCCVPRSSFITSIRPKFLPTWGAAMPLSGGGRKLKGSLAGVQNEDRNKTSDPNRGFRWGGACCTPVR